MRIAADYSFRIRKVKRFKSVGVRTVSSSCNWELIWKAASANLE